MINHKLPHKKAVVHDTQGRRYEISAVCYLITQGIANRKLLDETCVFPDHDHSYVAGSYSDFDKIKEQVMRN